jgi:hypothetical protein
VDDRAGQRAGQQRQTRTASHETALVKALTEVRAAAESAAYPLPVPGANQAREVAGDLVTQIDDYLLPRLRRLDAPLLAVVGGSTGVGKSTLVNSLIRAPISPAGALRPTTRAPLVVHHPVDATWFSEPALLPDFVRATRPAQQTLQVVNAPALTPGLALLDAPDIDSVVAPNRVLARELLAAADLWLFVTTAARYADAVPWDVLHGARDRGIALAVVLNRVPPEVGDDIASHLSRMLGGEGLGDAPVFVVPETTLDGYGLLPELEVLPVKRWIDGVARDMGLRRATARRTLLGAVAAVPSRVGTLARTASDQVRAASHLEDAARSAFADGVSGVDAAVRSGGVFSADVERTWRELVSGGELRLVFRARVAARRDRTVASLVGRPLPGRAFHAAVAAALADLIRDADTVAAQRCREAWRVSAEGRALLAAESRLGWPWPGFADAAHDAVHGWQSWIRSTARAEAPRVRTQTRSYATAATVLLVTAAALAPDSPDSVVAGSYLQRAALADLEMRGLAERARAELIARVGALFEAEVERHRAAVAAAAIDSRVPQQLRDVAGRLARAQSALAGQLEDAA